MLFNHSPSSPAFSPLTLFTQSRFSWLNPCALPQDCSSCNCSTVSSLRPLASSPITPCSSSHTSVAFLAPPPSSLVVSQKEVTRSFKLVLLGPSIPSALHCSSKSSIKSTTSAGLVPSWLPSASDPKSSSPPSSNVSSGLSGLASSKSLSTASPPFTRLAFPSSLLLSPFSSRTSSLVSKLPSTSSSTLSASLKTGPTSGKTSCFSDLTASSLKSSLGSSSPAESTFSVSGS